MLVAGAIRYTVTFTRVGWIESDVMIAARQHRF